jgi:hypothetical protein
MHHKPSQGLLPAEAFLFLVGDSSVQELILGFNFPAIVLCGVGHKKFYQLTSSQKGGPDNERTY